MQYVKQNIYKVKMKKFQLYKQEIEFNSTTAREAAMKAASKNFSQIILLESDKLHVFEGTRRLLRDEEHTCFTKKNKILYKSNVRKLHYEKLTHPCNLKKIEDVEYIDKLLNDMSIQY